MALAYEPPSGEDDLESDSTGDRWREVTAAGLTLRARVPSAQSLSALRKATSPTAPEAMRRDMLGVFLQTNLHPDSIEAVWRAMLAGEGSPRLLDEVMQAVATLGTARPFRAVASLTATAAVHWRLVRGRLLAAGITDPLSLGLHALLDFVEVMVTENSTEDDLGKHYFALYRPAPGQQFAEAETDASFDAFLGALDN